MLDGHRPKNVKLRQVSSGLCRLSDVELVIRYGHMYLCRGWEKFYRFYDLRQGYFLRFRYDGEAMLIVRVFNTTMCCMRYQDDDDASTLCLFFPTPFRIILAAAFVVAKLTTAFAVARVAAAAPIA